MENPYLGSAAAASLGSIGGGGVAAPERKILLVEGLTGELWGWRAGVGVEHLASGRF